MEKKDFRGLGRNAQEALRARAVYLVVTVGKTQMEAAQAVGASRQTVNGWLKRHAKAGEPAWSWCTCKTEHAITPTPICYAIARVRRTESGRPAASIWFNATTPMAASVCWAAKPRARNRGPISALYRPIVVSTTERLP